MNCIIIDDDEVSRRILEGFVSKSGFLNLVKSFSGPIEALSFLSDNKVDLIFLDIEMPDMNGMEFISAIESQMPQVILTTSHKEFALDAFEYNVTDFLVKPIVYSRFFKAASKAKELAGKKDDIKTSDDIVFIKKGSSIVSIKKADILWVEALGDYITLNTRKGKYTIHATMKSIEDKLSGRDYIRVHRSFIIRVDAIDTIDDNCITYGDKLIPIGKSYKEPVMKKLNIM